MAWCEGCPCHGHLMRGARRSFRLQLLRADLGSNATKCILAGMRANEAAGGGLVRVFELLARLEFTEFLASG
eukprot:4646262-Alexandrium_andersonii.AAC.1